MSLSNPSSTRGNLRLVYASSRPIPAPPRATLAVRGVLARARVQVLGLLALAGAVTALAPLLFRRGPSARRAQVPRRAARVIPLPQRQRASPR